MGQFCRIHCEVKLSARLQELSRNKVEIKRVLFKNEKKKTDSNQPTAIFLHKGLSLEICLDGLKRLL